mmetsp:Transcript_79485/g.140286  ORF Transcript_79485/g.140286 Transcript_79485/m.140286 type:complete len:571 (+) Transcript_79485:81-1793(+)
MAGFSESQRRWLSEVIQADQKALTKELERQHLALLEKLGLLDQLAGPNGQQKVQLQLPGSPDNMTAEKEREFAAMETSAWAHAHTVATTAPKESIQPEGAKPPRDHMPMPPQRDHPLEPPQTRKTLIATGTSDAREYVVAAEKPNARNRKSVIAFIELIAAAAETHDDSKSWWHPVNCSRSNNFDAFFCFLIIINTVLMAFESQLLGLEAGREIGYRHYTQAGQDTWPGAEEAFAVLEWFFGILYTLELVIKVLGMKAQFFVDIACLFDFLIVGFWLVEKVLGNIMPLDPNIMKLARLARLLRLLRLLRKMSGFDSLYVMVTAMRHCAQVLFWAFTLLLFLQAAFALLLTQLVMPQILNTSVAFEDRLRLFEYFGTFSRSMLSMFEITLGNWPPVARILQEDVAEGFLIFSIGHKIIIGFALIGILNGVFMQETFKVASSDDEIMMRQKRMERKMHRSKMDKLFKSADIDSNGRVELSELRQVLSNEECQTWLAAQQLSFRDADILFSLLDDGDSALTADELIRGVERLKGPAKALDMALLANQHQAMHLNMVRVMNALKIPDVTEKMLQ